MILFLSQYIHTRRRRCNRIIRMELNSFFVFNTSLYHAMLYDGVDLSIENSQNAHYGILSMPFIHH